MLTLAELKEMMRVQLPPMGERREIRGLRVAPDVWAELVAEVPEVPGHEPAPMWHWHVTVDRYLPPGAIVPVDAQGRPMLKRSVEPR